MNKPQRKARNMPLAWLLLVGIVSHARSLETSDSSISWEIHQAFPTWVEGERWQIYAKLTNVGVEVVPLSGASCLNDVEQIRIVPQMVEGKHSHGGHGHSHYLPKLDAPWMSRLDWRDTPLSNLEHFPSRALKPGESEVLGELDFRFLAADWGMPDPHMKSFQLALRLGPDRYALSQSQPLVFAGVPPVEKNPVLIEIEKASGGRTPIRQLQVGGEQWLFRRTTRIARIPPGATPRFSTADEKRTLVIEFDGVAEEPVRVDIAQGFPLCGSEQTVPHLHRWRSLTSRSMFEHPGTPGGFYKETGLTLEKARGLKWDGTDPELKAQSASRISSDTTGDGGGAVSLKDNSSPSQRGTEGSRIWIWVSIVLLATAGLILMKLRRTE